MGQRATQPRNPDDHLLELLLGVSSHTKKNRQKLLKNYQNLNQWFKKLQLLTIKMFLIILMCKLIIEFKGLEIQPVLQRHQIPTEELVVVLGIIVLQILWMIVTVVMVYVICEDN